LELDRIALQCKAYNRMNSVAATEHLQAIRTLMERSALYRRALAPIMALAGGVGTAGGLAGCLWLADTAGRTPVVFVAYWLALSLVPMVGSLWLARSQALRDGEPFWSPPTRRVVKAASAPGVVGLAVGVATLVELNRAGAGGGWPVAALFDLPLLWVMLYGCGLHAAGAFMPRGIRWFGAVLVLGGVAVYLGGHATGALGQIWAGARERGFVAHLLMGGFFGVLHLAYAAYLAITERNRTSL
jgi:hypothetical protein